ncbi:zinc finger protein castor homolog 1-like [Tubulanus polymorphus]|uniref:zinc finger protein castor homolog 1-like n=1 Tax=Tubulanus polymorphus TaxID=672921 RepID=UPI003DA66348
MAATAAATRGLLKLDAICAKLKDSENESETSHTPSASPTPLNCEEHSFSRKARRKNAAPKSLKYMRSEDAKLAQELSEIQEYELNNKDIDFAQFTTVAVTTDSEIDIDENSNELDSDGDLYIDLSGTTNNEHPIDFDDDRSDNDVHNNTADLNVVNDVDEDATAETDNGYNENENQDICRDVLDQNMSSKEKQVDNHNDGHLDDNGVIDLSLKSASSKLSQSIDVATSRDQSSDIRKPDEVLSNGIIAENLKHKVRQYVHLSTTSLNTSHDARELKDYAESTVSELLGMYGLAEEAHSITRYLPLLDFASGHTFDQEPSISVAALPSITNAAAEQRQGEPASLPISPHYANYKASPELTVTKAHNSSTTIEASPNPRFVESAAYVKACFSRDVKEALRDHVAQSLTHGLLPDYSKYIKRYSSFHECDGFHCRDMAFKEHYHCLDCSFRVFVRKEEMIRHFKWHKKRDDSLQHGFLRYSLLDDCSDKFKDCQHNKKQTHYHCVQNNCNKVYISTSDVQMHANYHRKDSAIIQEGFQRFRATEDCGTISCSFYGQRTTHFHCRRKGCQFTFKNKADMEKHKTYHQKDEVLGKDGFKKFMKYEHCSFPKCKYSKVSNHIHCIRPGCHYVLHSTGQLYSHKRKHERRDFEMAYTHFRTDELKHDENSSSGAPSPSASPINSSVSAVLPGGLMRSIAMEANSFSTGPGGTVVTSTTNTMSMNGGVTTSNSEKVSEYVDLEELRDYHEKLKIDDTSMDIPSSTMSDDTSSLHQSETTPFSSRCSSPSMSITPIKSEFSSGSMITAVPTATPMSDGNNSAKYASVLNLNESLSLPIPRFKLEPSEPTSELNTKESTLNELGPLVPPVMRSPEKRERDESWKKYLTRYTANDPCRARCQLLYKDHYHCNQTGCDALFKTKERVREHAKLHEQEERITDLTFHSTSADADCCVDGCSIKGETHHHCLWPDCDHIVKAEAGSLLRLQHHRHHEQQRPYVNGRPRFSATSFIDGLRRRRGRPPKYPKEDIPVIPTIKVDEETLKNPNKIVRCFKIFENDEACPDELCPHYMREHYHCIRPRCHHVTNSTDVMNLHAREFHNYVTILDGFEFFDRGVDCRRVHCSNNRTSRHFHCTRSRCDYSFIRHSTMFQHDKKHQFDNSQHSILEPSSHTAVKPIKTDIPIASKTSSVGTVKSSGTFFPISTIPPLEGSMTGKSNEAGSLVKPEPYPFRSIAPAIGALSNAITSPIVINMATNTAVLNLTSLAASQGFTLPISSVTGHISTPLSIIPTTSVENGQSAVNQAPLTLQQASAAAEALLDGTVSSSNTAVTSTTTSILTVPSAKPIVTAVPLSLLFQPHNQHQVVQQQPPPPAESWSLLKQKMHYVLNQNCGRPFCKLKKRDHYHCFDCNQAFSDPERLKTHVGRHGIKFKPTPKKKCEFDMRRDSGDNLSTKDCDLSEDESILNSSLNLNPAAFSNMVSTPQQPSRSAEIDLDDSEHELEIDESATNSEPQPLNQRHGRKRSLSPNSDIIDNDAIIVKQRRFGSPRVNRDEPIPEGYIRFFAHEDCMCRGCSYRQSTTHFHCKRPTCMFGICSRQRIDQHSLRHLRIDKIMGDDFYQYRANIECAKLGCLYSMKATHFHCNKCQYTCTDTIKVTAHRKQHLKKDFFVSQGFKKFPIGINCTTVGCKYSAKQTHYHCTYVGCDAAVVGQAQMPPHRLKHVALSSNQQ